MLIHSINVTGHKKSACCLRLLVFLETSLHFGNGGPRFLTRVTATMISVRSVKLGMITATMISKRSVKLGIIVYCIILYKDDSYNLATSKMRPFETIMNDFSR